MDCWKWYILLFIKNRGKQSIICIRWAWNSKDSIAIEKTTKDWGLIGFVRFLSENKRFRVFFTTEKSGESGVNDWIDASLTVEIIQEIDEEGANVQSRILYIYRMRVWKIREFWELSITRVWEISREEAYRDGTLSIGPNFIYFVEFTCEHGETIVQLMKKKNSMNIFDIFVTWIMRLAKQVLQRQKIENHYDFIYTWFLELGWTVRYALFLNSINMKDKFLALFLWKTRSRMS